MKITIESDEDITSITWRATYANKEVEIKKIDFDSHKFDIAQSNVNKLISESNGNLDKVEKTVNKAVKKTEKISKAVESEIPKEMLVAY